MDETLKPIPTDYRKNGYAYHLLLREGKLAIYSQTYKRHTEPCAYELVRIRVRKAQKTPRFDVAEGEYLPSTAEWGRQGWTFSCLSDARDRLNRIVSTPHTKKAAL